LLKEPPASGTVLASVLRSPYCNGCVAAVITLRSYTDGAGNNHTGKRKATPAKIRLLLLLLAHVALITVLPSPVLIFTVQRLSKLWHVW